MQQFARIRTKDSIVPVILKGEQPLDLRRVVSDITADGGVALELSQNSDVTRTLRAPSPEQLIGPANGTWGRDAGEYRRVAIFRPTESSSRRRRMGSMRPSTVEFQ
jgi:hypothetical protein